MAIFYSLFCVHRPKALHRFIIHNLSIKIRNFKGTNKGFILADRALCSHNGPIDAFWPDAQWRAKCS